jgi:hypothetical protein
LLLLFFVPGFISLKIYGLLLPIDRIDFSKAVFETVAYSALNYAALLPLVMLVQSETFRQSYPVLTITFLYTILIIAPAIWAYLFYWVSTSRVLPRHPVSRPWDWVFRQRQFYWVIVNLADGRQIAGRYSTRSHASAFPAEESIHLEEVYQITDEGLFGERVKDSQGVIVLSKDISSVELFTHYALAPGSSTPTAEEQSAGQ